VSLTRCGASESASAAKLGKILAFCCEQILDPFANHRAAPRPPPKPRRTIFANALKRNKKKQNEITLISGNLRHMLRGNKWGVQ